MHIRFTSHRLELARRAAAFTEKETEKATALLATLNVRVAAAALADLAAGAAHLKATVTGGFESDAEVTVTIPGTDAPEVKWSHLELPAASVRALRVGLAMLFDRLCSLEEAQIKLGLADDPSLRTLKLAVEDFLEEVDEQGSLFEGADVLPFPKAGGQEASR